MSFRAAAQRRAEESPALHGLEARSKRSMASSWRQSAEQVISHDQHTDRIIAALRAGPSGGFLDTNHGIRRGSARNDTTY